MTTGLLLVDDGPVGRDDLILFEHSDAIGAGIQVRLECLAVPHRNDFFTEISPG